MNLLLFRADELSTANNLLLTDHRATHLIKILKVEIGQEIKAGLLDGSIGTAKVTDVQIDSVALTWQVLKNPPPPVDCTLVLALPRPKMMRRILQNISAMGIKEVHLINSWKVDKSYWKSPSLEKDAIDAELILGLSQSVDTRLPSVILHRLFKPFAEDMLPALCAGKQALLAHPYSTERCPIDVKASSILAIGPEGGFTEYELELLQDAGMKSVNIGPRILRVETAVPALLSRLYPA